MMNVLSLAALTLAGCFEAPADEQKAQVEIPEVVDSEPQESPCEELELLAGTFSYHDEDDGDIVYTDLNDNCGSVQALIEIYGLMDTFVISNTSGRRFDFEYNGLAEGSLCERADEACDFTCGIGGVAQGSLGMGSFGYEHCRVSFEIGTSGAFLEVGSQLAGQHNVVVSCSCDGEDRCLEIAELAQGSFPCELQVDWSASYGVSD